MVKKTAKKKKTSKARKVAKVTATAKVATVPRAVLRIFKATGVWHWSFLVNGRLMADSAEGYAQKQTARRAWKKFHARVTGAKFTIVEGN